MIEKELVMPTPPPQGHLGRRRFLQMCAVCAGAVGAGWTSGAAPSLARPSMAAPGAAPLAEPPTAKRIVLAATDGWISIPGSARYHPDPWAPAPFTTWGFGFRDITGLTPVQVAAQHNHFQNSAPILYTDEAQPTYITLRNLGMRVRPDLTDSHSIHWHGFRNAIPLFDGVPEVSVAVPIGREFTYFYRPVDPGTYMYHCHFEDVEHVSMGMTGVIFVRPAQNAGTGSIPAGRYVYNDGVAPSSPRSTAYDREWCMFLSELWTQERWEGAHIQEHDWSEYHADSWLLNGRCYPDTLAPNGTQDADGNLVAPAGSPQLERQPISSLVQANAGERVLLRFVNLGFGQQAMTLQGIPMRVVGKDATPLVGRDGTDNSYLTDTIYIGPGESLDAVITCPNVSSVTTFLLANRNYGNLHNPGQPGLGGQLTEVRVHPAGSLGPQTEPNH
jgi:FtsP/CotA-like multicopper oxidase with cupredoxin domain